MTQFGYKFSQSTRPSERETQIRERLAAKARRRLLDFPFRYASHVDAALGGRQQSALEAAVRVETSRHSSFHNLPDEAALHPNHRKFELLRYAPLSRFEAANASREEGSDFSIDSQVELKLDRKYNQMVVLNDKLKTLDDMDKRDAKCKLLAQAILEKMDHLRSDIDQVNGKRLLLPEPDLL